MKHLIPILILAALPMAAQVTCVGAGCSGSSGGGGDYTLPVAAPTVLGGVKVGTNLAIDAGGILSAGASGQAVNNSAATTTRPIKEAASTPETCGVGEQYWNTTSKTIFACTATDTWSAVGTGGSGDVTGPASSTANGIARFSGTGGKTLKNSGITIDDSNNLNVPGIISAGDGTVAGELVAQEITSNGTEYLSWLAPDARTTTLRMLLPTADPQAGQVMLFGAPSSTKSTIEWGTPVLSGGALGTPSSGTLTNATGLPLAGIVAQAADTVVMNATAGSAAPTAVAMPTCTTGASRYNTTSHSWECVSVSATTLTTWISPWFGATGIAVNSGTQVSSWGFVVPVSVTFSTIYSTPQTADAGGLYSLNIANTSGALLCHQSTGAAMGTAGTVQAFACAEGSVTLTPGTYLLMMAGSATTGKLYGTAANSVTGDYFSRAVSGCSASSGVISGTCTAPSSSAANYTTGIPGFVLK